MADSCYVYAITCHDALLPKDIVGIEAEALNLIPCQQLAAAVGFLDGTPEAFRTPDRLLKHENVVESLSRCFPLLPVRFGTVMSSAHAVSSAVSAQGETLVADLIRVGHKMEFGVSVLWEPSTVVEYPCGNGDRPQENGQFPRGAGTQYLRRKLEDDQRENELRSRATDFYRLLNERLLHHAVDSRHSILPTSRLAVRASYLTEPSQCHSFRGAFEKARSEFSDVHLLLSGPWPPYSFVSPPAGQKAILA